MIAQIKTMTYLTHQAEKLQGKGRQLCVRTASGSDRIRRNLRNPTGLPDPVATARGSDTELTLFSLKLLGLVSQVCYCSDYRLRFQANAMPEALLFCCANSLLRSWLFPQRIHRCYRKSKQVTRRCAGTMLALRTTTYLCGGPTPLT